MVIIKYSIHSALCNGACGINPALKLRGWVGFLNSDGNDTRTVYVCGPCSKLNLSITIKRDWPRTELAMMN
jgi:hypothetical protein